MFILIVAELQLRRKAGNRPEQGKKIGGETLENKRRKSSVPVHQAPEWRKYIMQSGIGKSSGAADTGSELAGKMRQLTRYIQRLAVSFRGAVLTGSRIRLEKILNPPTVHP